MDGEREALDAPPQPLMNNQPSPLNRKALFAGERIVDGHAEGPLAAPALELDPPAHIAREQAAAIAAHVSIAKRGHTRTLAASYQRALGKRFLDGHLAVFGFGERKRILIMIFSVKSYPR
jgi:hypothetical protein